MKKYKDEDMLNHPAKIIEFKKYDEHMPISCSICFWEGTPESSQYIEYSDTLLTVSCPKCEKMLLIASWG